MKCRTPDSAAAPTPFSSSFTVGALSSRPSRTGAPFRYIAWCSVKRDVTRVRSRAWKGWSPTQLLGVELAGKALGIFGMGRIGRGIARRARGFGMTIHYSNRTRLPPALEEGAVFHADPEAMLAAVDALALASPSTPETRGFLDSRRIGLMKRGALVVNIGRGDIIDEPVLIRALREHWIAGAGLDVASQEPLPADSPLYDLPNLILTPHVSGGHERYAERLGKIFTDNLRRYRAGQPLRNRVDKQRGY